MRLLKDDDVIALLARADGLAHVAACEHASPPPDDFTGREGWLNYQVASGRHLARDIALNGRVFATLYFFVDPRPHRVLVVTACHSFDRENRAPELEKALDILARQTSCTFIEFQTRRVGLAEHAQKTGYKIGGVTFIRPANP